MKKAIILNEISIERKIRRLSYEIYERNFNSKNIFLFGVKNNGIILSKLLKKELANICNIGVNIVEVEVDKKKSIVDKISFNKILMENNKLPIIVIDDVCNSGKTLMKVISNIVLKFNNPVSTLVLVDRKNHSYPIKANYVGLEISTTLRQFIEVELESDKVAYLFWNFI